MQKIEAILQRLSPERLRVAADFLAYLDERESNDATEELLSIPQYQQEKLEITMMSESSLAKDWLSPEEDEAWQDL
ncbi:DUF2281 domain-containing protein [Pseudanabaena sp. FACHB-1050]|uniref:DUF2281 domain-containing protein n=1 Tax=Phormidium tenue FACHB-1050 TaxID=2692857 RepID=A0ABR8CGI4_9CYAN|nr:DUF2281 domain-containing protein [Phormidium tenue FACHB-1050]